jgi:hypothetical protein
LVFDLLVKCNKHFDTEGGSIDSLVAKDEALTDFMQKTNTKGWTYPPQRNHLLEGLALYSFARKVQV